MRRKLPLLRRRFQGSVVSQPTPDVSPLLIEANQAFRQGDYSVAAERFEQLAAGGETSALRRQPQFFLQAGRARMLAGQVEAGMILLRRGLKLLADQHRWEGLRRLGPRMVQVLQNRGLAQQAEQIKSWLHTLRVTGDEASVSATFDLDTAAPKTGSLTVTRLPTHCPSCGAPVDPREVEWAGPQTAECLFCGNILRVEP